MGYQPCQLSWDKLSTMSAGMRQAINHVSCHKASYQPCQLSWGKLSTLLPWSSPSQCRPYRTDERSDLDIWAIVRLNTYRFHYKTFYLIALFLGMSYISRIATLSRTPSGQTALKPLGENGHDVTNLADLLEPFPNFFFIISCICLQVLYVF